MNRIKKILKNKIVLTAAVLAATVGIGGAAFAGFGPDRPTRPYVQGQPGFDHVTFNSFTGVPNIGDERNFMTGKIAGAPNGFYDPMNQVRDGNEILVRVYVHNNADTSLNASGNGVARNTRVNVQIPEGQLAQAHQMKGAIYASNAQPQTVTDTLDVNANYPFQLDYVEGSAQITTNFVNDLPLSDEITRGGVLIGDDVMDGNLPGCFEYVALVTYRVKVKAPNYTVQKSVRVEGEDSTKWRENAVVAPGSKVEWMIEFKNTGATKLDDVAVFDQLPAKTKIVPGTTKIYNVSNPSGVAAGTDNVVANGINVGNYFPNSNVRVVFKTEINKDEDFECGKTKLINYGYAKPGNQGAVRDDASVEVDRTKNCKPDDRKPTYSCDLLKAEKLTGRTVKYTASASAADGATIKNYVFDFGDGQSLTTDKNVVEHTYAQDGQFVTRVKVNVAVGNETKVAESDRCAAVVNFNTPVTPAGTTPGAPTALPETGAGSVVAAFMAVTAASTAAYYAVQRRLLGRI